MTGILSFACLVAGSILLGFDKVGLAASLIGYALMPYSMWVSK